MINRRKYLATISTTMGGVALAGCSSDGSNDGGDSGADDGDNANGDDDTSTSTQDPWSQLDVSGFVTADEASEMFLTQVAVTNPTDQPATADFSAVWSLEENNGDISSDSVEKTIEPDGSQEFQIEMLKFEDLTAGRFISIYYLGFNMELLVNGEAQANTCPSSELTNSNEQGCEYPFGVLETHVEVEYDGDWSGAAGGGGSTGTVDKRSSITSETTDISYVDVSDDASIISANAQKQDDSSGELTIRIIHRDEVVAEQSTSAGYGVAQVSTTL